MPNNLTPMLEQYLSIKNQYKDEILFYRLGDFYEMFFDDAIKASKVLGLTLTKRSSTSNIPMCGVPYHVSETYISKLIENGFKVAICDQVEDPKLATKLVKREVTRVVTPGTFTDTNFLNSAENNYIMSIYVENYQTAVSYSDYMTGEIFTTQKTFINTDDILTFITDEISKIFPSEILLLEKTSVKVLQILKIRNIFLSKLPSKYSDIFIDVVSELSDNIKLQVSEKNNISLNMLINYLGITQKTSLLHLKDIIEYNVQDYLGLDENTKRNLELTKGLNSGTKKGSLLQVLDSTSTAMGSRELKKWIDKPLIDKTLIENRYNVIEELRSDLQLSNSIATELNLINDIERLSFKIANSQISPKEIKSLSNSLIKIENIIDSILNSKCTFLKQMLQNINPLHSLSSEIESTLVENPPVTLDEKRFIKTGYSVELDELFNASENGQKLILELEMKERNRTGIKNLKIKYNKILGYFIDITKSFIDKVPQDYIRKQTLVGSERYFSVELKEMESKILGAKEQALSIQIEILNLLRQKVFDNLQNIQILSGVIAKIDVLNSLAIISNENNYVRPIVNDEKILKISAGRHPIVESLNKQIMFVPNDTYMDSENYFHVITGPNMAGKSTYMRQVALIIIMAQIGSYVPADRLEYSIVDRVFTRIGASDNLSGGDSTFMVEMKEVSNILKNAKDTSIVILDEVGRGTSTFDGLSIAWAISEYIVKNIKSMTLFATHYHELTELESIYDSIKNLTIAVDKQGEDIVFLRKIINGFSSNSYGIEVAKLAGINTTIINRAKDILEAHEKNENIQLEIGNFYVPDNNSKTNLFIEDIKSIDINILSPLQALNVLGEIIQKASEINDN